MRTARAPCSPHPKSRHPQSWHLGGLRSMSPRCLSSPRPSHLPPYPGRATCERSPRAQASPPSCPHLPQSPQRSSLTCCGTQVPASVMQSRLRSLAPSSRRPCAASASPLHGSPSRSRCSRGESPAASGSSKYRRARGRGRERPAEGGGGNKGSREEAQMGRGRREMGGQRRSPVQAGNAFVSSCRFAKRSGEV